MLMGIFIFIHDQVDKLKVLNIITNANCHFSNSPAAAHKMYSQCLSHGWATCEIAIKEYAWTTFLPFVSWNEQDTNQSSRSLLYHVFPTSCISSRASTTTLVLDYYNW